MINLKKLEEEQNRLAKRVSTKGKIKKLKLVGGVDESFIADKIISAIVICKLPDMKVIERKSTRMKAGFPYIPTYLSYREGPPILSVYKKVKNRPDILFVNGCGINHPRKIGLASYVGVKLGIPTIGVTQNLLCGEIKKGKIYLDGKQVGWEIKRARKKPIYTAPGNKISLKETLRVTKLCMGQHRLPEPLAMAHIFASDEKRKA